MKNKGNKKNIGKKIKGLALLTVTVICLMYLFGLICVSMICYLVHHITAIAILSIVVGILLLVFDEINLI